jgi:fumarate hydratase class II
MDEQLGALRTAPAGSAAGDVVEADGRRWRVETDALGGVLVPADRLWGAQTQRSLANFAIGTERMPHAVHHAYGLVKRAAAEVNARRGRLDPALADAIVAAADEVAAGALDDHLVLSVWQTGSGTQTNMNVNEVVANRACALAGGAPGTKSPVHPNDHVNRGQSSNDTFPTAVHVAAVLEVRDALRPQLDALAAAIDERAARWHDVVKTGRTHLQDATPLTVGQEWHAWASLLRADAGRLDDAARGLHPLAIGGTAVGTGTGSPEGFGPDVAAALAQLTGEPFTAADDPFAALSSSAPLLAVSAALRGLATTLEKIADDLRWLGSGPRAGLHELALPENEPGSSIMPGKVNPTQAEAVLMVAAQVHGLDAAVAHASARANLQLHVMRPVVAYDVLRAVDLLASACDSLRRHCIEGVKLDRSRIDLAVSSSLMLVTALSPVIGYDRASAIAHDAHERGIGLREAALDAGVGPEVFDAAVDPARMTRPDGA